MPVTTTTFRDLWMSMRLYVPGAPVFLLQKWTRNAFRQLADRRIWSWQLLEGQLVWDDARTVPDVTATFGSPTITKVGAFSSADLGRTFRVGSYPLYTIVNQTANTLTLDRAYEGLTEGTLDQDAQILDAYAVMPANFEQFVAIVDPVNQRLIPWWATQEEISLIDPIRMAAESVPRLLASASLSTYTPTLGHVRYEYYPKPTARGALQYFAKALPTNARDDDPIPGMLGARIDVLEAGILAQAAKWPGTSEVKNPYFNLALATQLQKDFDALANQLDLRDDDVYQQSIDRLPWQKFGAMQWAWDTNLLRETDATLGAYWGSGGGSSAWL